MMDLPHPMLILLGPLLAGLLIPILSPRMGEKVSKIGIAAQAVSFFLSLILLYDVAINPPINTSPLTLPEEKHFLSFGLYVDRLAAVMMVLVTGVSTLIHVFSRTYLHQDPGYTRYFTLLSLITFALLCMIASPNLLMLFIFWQLITWLLYLLLAHNYTHKATYKAAFKTFIILRIGDICFLGGVILAYHLYGTLEFPLLFERAAESTAMLTLLPGIEMKGVTAVALLIFIGAMSKSAQFPMQVWLPDTMYGPTPVSALMHAGIVNAGGFLLNRLAPLYGLSPSSLNFIFVIGALTTLLGASVMLTQSDVKKMLGYSTIAQMGYMIMECGLGAFALAIFHFIAHGLFKAYLFLSAGNVIHTTRIEPLTPPPPEITQRLSAPKTAQGFSRVIWFTGIIITLALPLIILLAAHDVFHIPLTREAPGAVIFLFFGWVTSSQAVISLYRMNAVSSWKVVCAMISALGLIIFTYLFAGELFTIFLYPAPGEAAFYFEAAALPLMLFDLFVVICAIGIISVWVFLYAKARGHHISVPTWIDPLKNKIYVLLLNHLYLDFFYKKIAHGIIRFSHRIDKRYLRWIP